MRWTDVTAHWPSLVPSILTRWPELDEDEVLSADGDRNRLARHMATTFDYDESDARASLDEWIKGQEPVDAVMDDTRDNERIRASRRDIAPGEDPSDDDARFGDDDVEATPIGRS